jgi:hypothetical protein
MQELRERGDWVQVSECGPNALDFHIAFMLGQMSEREKDTVFRVVSKDKGFDPLMEYLKKCKIGAQRMESIHEVFGVKKPNPSVPVAPSPAKKPAPAKTVLRTVVKPAKPAAGHPHLQAKPKPASKNPLPQSVPQLALNYVKMQKQPKATHPGTLTALGHDIQAKCGVKEAGEIGLIIAILKKTAVIGVDDASGKVSWGTKKDETVRQTPPPSPAQAAPPPDRCSVFIGKLLKGPRPRKLATLRNHIKASFTKENVTDADIDAMIEAMKIRRTFSIAEDGIKLTWPDEAVSVMAGKAGQPSKDVAMRMKKQSTCSTTCVPAPRIARD